MEEYKKAVEHLVRLQNIAQQAGRSKSTRKQIAAAKKRVEELMP